MKNPWIRATPAAISPEISSKYSFDSTQKNAIEHNGKLLAARLVQLRLAKGLTQREVGKAIHLAGQTISAFESGRRIHTMHFSIIVALARFYEIEITEFLDLSLVTSEAIEKRKANAIFGSRPPKKKKNCEEKRPMNDHILCTPGSPAMCSECSEIWKEATA